MTEEEVRRLPQRQWAEPGDEEIPAPSCDMGHHPSPDAIGGYYGVQWLEVFRDAETNELYAVRCFDGTYRSKGAYRE